MCYSVMMYCMAMVRGDSILRGRRVYAMLNTLEQMMEILLFEFI